MIVGRTVVLLLVLAAIGGAIFYLNSMKAVHPSGTATENVVIPLFNDASSSCALKGNCETERGVVSSSRARPVVQSRPIKNFSRAKELVGVSGFINAEPFKLADLIGKKVILVDFWTYSCINCQRTIPYLNSWYEKYKGQGLEIVGVHTPEFEFEHKYENVQDAVKKFGIKYPVVLDNDYATWGAYSNRYWPHKYLIDIDGFIVYDHIGEGFYDETEKIIQLLLAERSAALNLNQSIASSMSHPASAPSIDASKIQSPEVYFGANRNEYLEGTKFTIGTRVFVATGSTPALNHLYLTGSWDITNEFGANSEAGAKVIFRYSAKDVYFVASGASGPVKIKILRDGKPISKEAGEDVDKNTGEVTINEERLYKLVSDPLGYGEHTIEIIIENPGLRAFTLTFG